MDGRTELYGVMGWPVEHTASPAMHNAAFAALGMNARYSAFPVPPEAAGDAVRGIRALGIRGMNVTVPHKQAVIPHLDALRGEAATLNAVNVIAHEDGALVGHNTDVAGFLRALREGGMDPAGAHVLMLGAGGAARAVLRAVQLGGAASATVLNRTEQKARDLARDLTSPDCPVTPAPFSNTDFDQLVENAKIIINTTSLGMKNHGGIPMKADAVTPDHCIVDIIYNPWETDFLKAAREKGARTLNGFGMLVYQAAEAFKIWTGRAAPARAMWDAGESFLRGPAA